MEKYDFMKKFLEYAVFVIIFSVILFSFFSCSDDKNKIAGKEGYSSVNLIEYSEKYAPYKDISEYYKPCTFLNSFLNETIIMQAK